jgi:hypothetical protein
VLQLLAMSTSGDAAQQELHLLTHQMDDLQAALEASDMDRQALAAQRDGWMASFQVGYIYVQAPLPAPRLQQGSAHCAWGLFLYVTLMVFDMAQGIAAQRDVGCDVSDKQQTAVVLHCQTCPSDRYPKPGT